MKYKIFKSIDTNNDYIALIYSCGFETVSEICKELESKGFIIIDEDYEGTVITFWLKKLETQKEN